MTTSTEEIARSKRSHARLRCELRKRIYAGTPSRLSRGCWDGSVQGYWCYDYAVGEWVIWTP